jgi:hypothetical protein
MIKKQPVLLLSLHTMVRALVASLVGVLCGALSVSLGGCKLQRSKLRSAQPTASKTITAPKTLKGNFSMLFEPSAGKRFPVHMSFVLDFAKGGAAAVFSSCIESDGGLAKSDEKKGIEPDRAIPFGVDVASAEAAVGLQNSTLLCAAQVPLADRVNGLKGASVEASLPSPSTAGQSTLQTSLAENGTATGITGTTATPGASLTPDTSGTPGSSVADKKGEGKVAPDAKGLFTFTSPPDKTGKSIRFTLRANDAGWHMESLEYFGITAFVGATETIAMHEE